MTPKAIRIVEHCLVASAICTASVSADDVSVNFEKNVLPVIETHCIRCHSPGIRKGDLSLETIDDLLESEYVVAGAPESSHLIDIITSTKDQPARMPQKADPLSDEDVDLLKRWISEGAHWPEGVEIKEKSKADGTFWSLQPVPDLSDQLNSLPGEDGRGPEHVIIDRFIERRLQEKKLQRNPAADRRTLIRRATYDLTGLPPTPEETQAFEDDKSPDAYERLIDRLLSSTHYGERWGRHWLDVVRFGESMGFERNVIVNNLWPFRDYVIRSINDDKPFDQLIREHIAGDVLSNDDPDVAVATAFLVAGPYDDVGNQDAVQAAQIRANTLDEIISATSEAFLGMTIGCSRCHDHKFDPITQVDYYGMYATFSGVRHGSVELATSDAKQQRIEKLTPLNRRMSEIETRQQEHRASILKRARGHIADYESQWPRAPVDRRGTEEIFPAVRAKFVRLVCEAQDSNAHSASGFGIDEFEIWSMSSTEDVTGNQPDNSTETSGSPVNVALAANGAVATGKAREIKDFPNAYGPQLAIDGKTGARFISRGTDLTIELAGPTTINRIVFSSAKNEVRPDQRKFVFVAEYRIEISTDGQTWTTVASGSDRRPVNQTAHLDRRLLQLETTKAEKQYQNQLAREVREIKQEMAAVPGVASVWIGRRVAADAQGPFHVFIGGSPQKKGKTVTPAGMRVFTTAHTLSATGSDGPRSPTFHYELKEGAPESERRRALATWIVHPENPLTPRVLANRIWHYHFGTGIVDTPSDFGYMGGRPTHPELLDYLAALLQKHEWRLKPMHRSIMLSRAYRQASTYVEEAAQIDGDSRLLWRFPPRRLSAEEIRDTILDVSGKLNRTPDGGPGFRLYQFLQDNVCTYLPLDQHGEETYRRAVYHQNARASVVDLMTEFDQPDCTFGAPRRAETTTPLQALTMLNHDFTIDMANALTERLERDAGPEADAQIARAYRLCFARPPSARETLTCRRFAAEHGMPALCRVLLNTSELIYIQ